jgi:hypothetical protein
MRLQLRDERGTSGKKLSLDPEKKGRVRVYMGFKVYQLQHGRYDHGLSTWRGDCLQRGRQATTLETHVTQH